MMLNSAWVEWGTDYGSDGREHGCETLNARLRQQSTIWESVGSYLSCVSWGQAGAELPLKGVIWQHLSWHR